MTTEPKAMRQAIEARIVEVKQRLLANAYAMTLGNGASGDMHTHIMLWGELGALEQTLSVQPPDYTGWIKAMG
jgi:hypothetical protein